MSLVADQRSLPTIAAEARREVEQVEYHWQAAVQHAIRAGQLLTEAKGQVKHGAWLPWLRENFPGAVRTAQVYMRLADPANAHRVAHLSSVNEAIAALAGHTAPRRLPRGKTSDTEWPLAPVAHIDGQLCLPGLDLPGLDGGTPPPPADTAVPAELSALWRELRDKHGEAVTVDLLRRLVVDGLREAGA